MASSLHIALYYPARLPVLRYGGTERVVTWLARGLLELGHRVTVIGWPGTVIPGAQVIPIDPKLSLQRGGPDLGPLIPDDCDLLHAHVPLAHPPALPFLWTFHGTAPAGRIFPPNTIALSADHARRHGIERWVHNGLDPADYRFNRVKGKRDLFLGRLHSVKGWQWAVRGARMAGRPITIAGGWRPSLRPGLRFVGKVGGEKKTALLADAAALWMPAQWDEPFGLTTIEAMVSGTPVVGTRRGALPEIITDSSGAMGDSLEELVAARSHLDRLDPEEVRANVMTRFTHLQMAESYLALYREEILRPG